MGGLSILLGPLVWILVSQAAPTAGVSEAVFGLALVVNYPHFAASYMLLYREFRPPHTSRGSFLWAGVAVPVILGGFIVYAFAKNDPRWLTYLISSLYFFVGWHYVKQVFGCIIVTSAQRKLYYQVWERRVILGSLFWIWMISFISFHSSPVDAEWFGLPNRTLHLPSWTVKFCYVSVAISLVIVALMQIRKYLEDGTLPAPPAVAAFAAIHAWHLPALYHPTYFLLIPFFHSLQYLPFVWRYVVNRADDEWPAAATREAREARFLRIVGFPLVAVILGVMLFEGIPMLLDQVPWGRPTALGPKPYFLAFALFVNVHHYFVDNVIWRSSNPLLRKYLFSSAP